MKLSVVIPCRNEKSHIREFLDSLLAQQLDPDWELEVLVADGMSEDGTREVLRDYAARAPYLRIIDNPGKIVSTGLNAAILAAQGEIILRMDAHSTYAPDYIQQCVRVLDESGADNAGGPVVAKGRGRFGKAVAAAYRSPLCCGNARGHDPNYEGTVDTVQMGCWRRSLFEKTGLFDPRLVRNQDDELNFRLRRYGGVVWQSPRIKSTYTPRSSIRALFRQYLQYGYWKVVVMKKHHGLASPRQAVPVIFVASLILGALMAAIAGAAKSPAAPWIAGALGLELGLYALFCIAAAIPFLFSEGPGVAALVPFAVAVYHVSYGLGFLIGILHYFRPIGVASQTGAPEFLTSLTR